MDIDVFKTWFEDMRRDVREMRSELREMSKLAADNVSHKESFIRLHGRLDGLEVQMKILAEELPLTRLVRKTVLGVIWAIVIAVVGAVLAIILKR